MTSLRCGLQFRCVRISDKSAGVGEAHDSSRLLDQEAGVLQVSEYCKDLLMRGQEEMSVEELRAEKYFELKKKKMQEKLLHLKEEEEQLRQELEKKRLQLNNRNSSEPAASESFVINESAAENPAGKSEASSSKRPNDLVLKADGQGLCLKIQCPGLPVDLKKSEPLTTSKPRENLSPIEEISVESLPSGGCSPLDHATQVDTNSNHLFAVNPCDADVRRRLLENSDIFSSPNFHSQRGSRPVVTERSFLHLGGAVFEIYSTLVDGDGFSVFEASTEDNMVLIKVDSCSTPWDFYQFGRLRSSSAGIGLPLISCFLFDDGCISVYTPPQGHTFTKLTKSAPDELLVGYQAIGLLQLLLQLALLQAAACGAAAQRSHLLSHSGAAAVLHLPHRLVNVGGSGAAAEHHIRPAPPICSTLHPPWVSWNPAPPLTWLTWWAWRKRFTSS
ncbi:hypothetical protein FQA47_019763 [Oryzias melastigma]|uniref:Uncharacterized protein n=1 Tax=Oryzias melastigma TaxID=30732 RepID=A0A834FLW6_ORYME|nr:hypothetical protein FQA47_019763 [Oryzias melastigma]